ncbi:unnamed protein product [Haemonchus placei]|uniref:ATP-synt_ab_N domain-containing protein n=1 Tax=Haemonchus placei TaxID=6290 RepID=A0A0N4WZX1_HAEPC|nr:unnamed protein product [Haemonchus placei]
MVAERRTPSIEEDIDQLKFFAYPSQKVKIDINDNECLLSSAGGSIRVPNLSPVIILRTCYSLLMPKYGS